MNEKLSVVKDHNYAFIHFYNRKDAQVALKEVNDSLFKDRYIRVQFSTSQGYTFNKFKGNEKKRCEFRNDESMKLKNSNYYTPSQSFMQPQNFNRSTSFNSNLLSQQLSSGLQHNNKSYLDPYQNRIHNSLSMNSNLGIENINQTR